MSTAYDKVVYPNRCHLQTHPDRLGVVGALFGVATAAPERCRMLELGCGDGANLLPLAYSFPESEFVGIDLSKNCIAAGQEAIEELRIKNLRLLHLDIAAFPRTGEPFDYIVAHGVYSWVPPEVRDMLMAVCSTRLAPEGVAFVSYNSLPGGHIRRLVWEIMRFHIRDVHDPSERVRQAVAVAQLIANSLEKPDTYRQLFKDQLEQIQRYGSGHLFHDDLAEVNDPIYFHQFVTHAAAHQLQFVGEADFFEMQDQTFTPQARAVLGQMEESRLTHEQYLDFLKCRRFRQTLLCHASVPLKFPAVSEPIETFHISSEARPDPAANNANPIVRFVEPKGGALEIDYPLAIAAFHILRQSWPATIPFPSLCEQAALHLKIEIDPAARRNMAAILLEAYRAGVVDFRRSPLKCASRTPERPSVWTFARWQVKRSGVATTLRGDNLRVEDEAGKRLFEMLDGSNSLDQLAATLLEEEPDSKPSDSKARLSERLNELARFALLEPK